MKWTKYHKDHDYSYTLGAFPTMELVENSPHLIYEILLSEKLRDREYFTKIFDKKQIPYRIADREIHRISTKENVFLAGVFRKQIPRAERKNHIICDQISDMGNLGNIIRTMLAMGQHDLILIGQTCDLFHPKSVRAGMGALFHIRMSHFDTFDQYRDTFSEPDREVFCFMLGEKAKSLPEIRVPKKWSLVFGAEAGGLEEAYRGRGTTVMIPQSSEVDSLNLTTAVAIGSYHFSMETVKGAKDEYGDL